MLDQARMAWGALWPAFVMAGTVMLIAWWPWGSKRHDTGTFRRWRLSAGAPACGGAFIISFLIISGWGAVHLRERFQWLLPMAAVATALGLTASALPWRNSQDSKDIVTRHFLDSSNLVGAALAIAATIMLHPPPLVAHPMIWKFALGGLVFTSWVNLEWLAQRRSGASLPLALWLIFGGLSMVFLHSALANFSLMAASLSAVMGAILIVALLNTQLNLSHGAMYVLAMLLAALLVIGLLYKPRPSVCYGLIAIAPAMLWLGEISAVNRLKSWHAVIVRMVLVAIPVAIAVAVTMQIEAAEEISGR